MDRDDKDFALQLMHAAGQFQQTHNAGQIVAAAVDPLANFIFQRWQRERVTSEISGVDVARELAGLVFAFDRELQRLASSSEGLIDCDFEDETEPAGTPEQRAAMDVGVGLVGENDDRSPDQILTDCLASPPEQPRRLVGHAETCECDNCKRFNAWQERERLDAELGVKGPRFTNES